MDWVTALILLNGVVRLTVGSLFCYMVIMTRNNPHPVGRYVAPVLFFWLSSIFAIDGIRSLIFVYGVVTTQAPALDGAPSIGVGLSLVATFLLCGGLLFSTGQVENKFVKPLRKAIAKVK